MQFITSIKRIYKKRLITENTAPDPPRNVRCVASSHSAILYWEHPSSRNRIKVRGYSIEWGIGAPNAKADVQGTETSFSIIELSQLFKKISSKYCLNFDIILLQQKSLIRFA